MLNLLINIASFLTMFVLWALAVYCALTIVYCLVELVLDFAGYKLTITKE